MDQAKNPPYQASRSQIERKKAINRCQYKDDRDLRTDKKF